MKNRLNPLLGWLCVISLVLGLAPVAGRAEPVTAEAQPGLSCFQSFVVDGSDLYVQAEDGLWRRDLLTQMDERLVTYGEMDRLWQINNSYSLFVWDHCLAVADWDHGKLWRWNGDAFDMQAALSGVEAINQDYIIDVAAQGDTLWVLNHENLLTFDLATGAARGREYQRRIGNRGIACGRHCGHPPCGHGEYARAHRVARRDAVPDGAA